MQFKPLSEAAAKSAAHRSIFPEFESDAAFKAVLSSTQTAIAESHRFSFASLLFALQNAQTPLNALKF